MNPSAQDVLRGCVENLEELLLPELQSPHAQSAGKCIRMLLNHVILRLDHEGAALAADCREKRELFAELYAEGALAPDLAADVAALLADLEPGEISIATLTARDDAWKSITEQALAEVSDHARGRVRAQLAAQVRREAAYCVPALDGPMF